MNCGDTHFMNKVGGKWKVLVIHMISTGQNRFSLLKASVPHISKQMLINQLHELEEHKIIERTVYAEVPPRGIQNILVWLFDLSDSSFYSGMGTAGYAG